MATGVPVKKKTKANYTDIFSTVMVKLAARHPDVVAITAAMPDGTGLKRFRKAYPERFFDVGIAEEHAVTFAAGLAVGGLHPVVAIYSSFLQRAYDQILHDVCLQNVPVIFAIDRAGWSEATVRPIRAFLICRFYRPSRICTSWRPKTNGSFPI